MDTGKTFSFLIILMILISNVPVAAANPATLTYSGSATGNHTFNLPGTIDASSINIDVTAGQYAAGNEFDYWIDTEVQTVYVPVSISGNGNTVLYVQKTAGYSPDGSAVFELFDDFESATLDSNIWDNSWSYTSISNGVITIENGDRLQSNTAFSDGHAVHWYLKPSGFSSTASQAEVGFGSPYDDSWNFGTSASNAITHRIYSESASKEMGTRSMTSGSSTFNTRLNFWSSEYNEFVSVYESSGSSAKFFYLNNEWIHTSNIPTVNLPAEVTPRQEKEETIEVDYVFVKQYIQNEPTVTVTDMGSYYQVDVQNNLATALTGYQIAIDGSSLGVTSSTESLLIADTLASDNFNLTASVSGDSETKAFDETNNENSYSLTPTEPISQIQFTVDDQTAAYDYAITIYFDNTAPTISNMSPTGGLQELEVTLSADISDIDMNGTYDNVTVDFYVSDELVDTVNITESGTVTSGPYTYPDGGSYDWYIVATDQFGGVTTSSTEQFSVPSVFQVRDAKTLDIVNDAEVEVRFYEMGDLQQTVVKNTSMGIVDLTGLPTNSEFVVVVRAPGYYARNTLVESLYDQNSIYIIPETESVNSLVLEITDYTGNFPSVSSKIFIQRSINISQIDETLEPGTYDWQTMSGDYIGADQRFQDTLIGDERYRFIVKNADGESRIIGQYNSLDSESLNLVVGELEWQFTREPGYNAEVNFIDTTDEGETPNGIIRFQYDDDADLTSSISVTCYERDNETNVIFTDSSSGTFGEYAASIPLTGEEQINKNWVVDYDIVRDGESKTFTLPISPGGGFLDFPIDGPMGSLVLGLILLFFALMFGGAVASKGAVITCALAAGLWFLGWQVIPIGVIIFAGAVSVLFLITDNSGDGIK